MPLKAKQKKKYYFLKCETHGHFHLVREQVSKEDQAAQTWINIQRCEPPITDSFS